MDLAMPVLDGRTALRILAADPATTQIPVLAMGGHYDVRPLEIPSTATFLPKPIEPLHLLEHIRTLLPNGRVGAPRAEGDG